jgi:EF hand
MWRYMAGGAGALLIVAASWLLGQTIARPDALSLPTTAANAASTLADLPTPPEASELSREEKRFNRYDKDRNGNIASAEYLLSRQKAYAKLDSNGDGVLSFDEYALKARTKFAGADKDKSGLLDRTEFATTRVIRKAKPGCPPAAAQPADASASDDG